MSKPVVGHGRVQGAPRAMAGQIGWTQGMAEQRVTDATKLASTPEGRRAMLDALAVAGVRWRPCDNCHDRAGAAIGNKCARCDDASVIVEGL